MPLGSERTNSIACKEKGCKGHSIDNVTHYSGRLTLRGNVRSVAKPVSESRLKGVMLRMGTYQNSYRGTGHLLSEHISHTSRAIFRRLRFLSERLLGALIQSQRLIRHTLDLEQIRQSCHTY